MSQAPKLLSSKQDEALRDLIIGNIDQPGEAWASGMIHRNTARWAFRNGYVKVVDGKIKITEAGNHRWGWNYDRVERRLDET